MALTYLRWLQLALVGGLALPFIVIFCSLWMSNTLQPWILVMDGVLLLVFAWQIFRVGTKFLSKLAGWLDSESDKQTQFLEALPEKLIAPGILVASMLSLLFELAVIRWQGTAFEFFAFYKNFGLLSCFAGLGVGYALANRERIPLVMTVPVLAFQQLLLTALRHGLDFTWIRSLVALPVQEQLNVGFSSETTVPEYVALYSLLFIVLLTTILASIPIGQLCGRLMSRTTPLMGYGANLLGSLIGVILMAVLSSIATPPVVWFTIFFALCALFVSYNRNALLVSLSAITCGVLTLAWPVAFGFEREFSPYQVLERGAGVHGWSMLKAAGLYYQKVMNLSMESRKQFPELEKIGRYYDLPYSLHVKPKRILVLGAGMGNDVAAALRSNPDHVDAVEIDPMIVKFGQSYHPEGPYLDKRVKIIVDDARSYLRKTNETYDAIVFGLLDSHALTSQASSLRLDSYVYTIQSFMEARSRLNPGGLISLSFSMPSPLLACKIHEMLKEAFTGQSPLCIGGEYDESFSFFQTKEGDVIAKAANLVGATGFPDLSNLVGQGGKKIDVSTDDWPFFYMLKRQWPLSYLPMIGMLVAVTYFFNRSFGQTTSLENLDFFFLGAGFMLIEAKAITELGLSFGNTWLVTGIVVAAILLMAFISNLFVQASKLTKPAIPYVLLLVSLAVGHILAQSSSNGTANLGAIGQVIVLTCPVMFSGLVFSAAIARTKNISAAMAANLLGAMCGGVLEYTAMYLGYQALYLVALSIYLAAFASSKLAKSAEA